MIELSVIEIQDWHKAACDGNVSGLQYKRANDRSKDSAVDLS